MEIVEPTTEVWDNKKSARRAWASANAQIDRGLGPANAIRTHDDLGQMSLGTAAICVDRNISISVSGPATFSLSILLEGQVTSCLDGGDPLQLTSGSMVIFASDRTMSGTNRLPAGQRLRVVDVRFSRKILEEAGGVPLSRFARELLVDRSIPAVGATFIAFPASKDILRIGEQVFDCGIKEQIARRLYLQGKCLEMLALTIVRLSSVRRPAARFNESDRERLGLARQFLHDRYEERWTIASLARAVGIGERKLKDGFRHMIGNSVHAYLKHIRLSAAAAMLSEGRSVTDVALSVGFENLSHFSKVFREMHGVNPSGYPRNAPP